MQAETIDRSIFGLYLNQARLNAYITLCHISELLNENTVDEDSLTEMPVLRHLDSTQDVIKAKRTGELISKHFPMLEIICSYLKPQSDKERTTQRPQRDIKTVLICLLKALNKKRNAYCHASVKTEPVENEKDLIRCLEDCFDAAVRHIKDVRGLEEKEVFHLRRKTSQGRGREKRTIDNPAFFYHFKDEQGLTEKGLAYLASLFLEKRDAWLFLKKQAGFKLDDTPGYKATLECYCSYRIKLPRPVLTSDVDADGLALDMLNELKKCPGELFDLLSKDHQNPFRVMEKSEDDEEGNENLMRRYGDRFAYFVLRYCDENLVFQDLRFHIDLGRYYFDFYDKETIDGGLYPRALDKQLKTFGRIREVKETVREQWKDILKKPDEVEEDNDTPYKADTTPHYHLVDNQIGFVITPDNALPDVKSPDGRIKLQTPDAWLSVYELPGMLFYGLRCGFYKAEALLIQYIKRQRKICEEVLRTGRIPDTHDPCLPKALKNSGNDAQPDSYAERKLDRLLQDTEQRLRSIATTEKLMADSSIKPGKKKYSDIRPGRLADFLARDILAMQAFNPDLDGSDKLTSINFQVLQATLAFYGAKRDEVRALFETIGLLRGENPHPFLSRVDIARCRSVGDFYKAYLQERKQFLEHCRANKRYDGQFLRPSRQRYAGGKQGIRTIAQKLLEQPVNIPTGFFEETIRDIVIAEDPSLKGRKMNTSYMIQAWFEKKFGKQQPFYFFPKTYPVAKKAKEYIKKEAANRKIIRTLKKITPEISYRELKLLVESQIDEQGRYDPPTLRQNLLNGCRDYKQNERILRRLKVQDMILFLLVENTLRDQLSFQEHALKLEDLMPDNGSPFNHPIACTTDIQIAFQVKAAYQKDMIDFIEKQYPGFYTQQGKRMILHYLITSHNTKLKDLGKYRRYLYDRRLGGLLIWKYAPNTSGEQEITYEEIQTEIESYERHRQAIVRLLYELDRTVVEQCGLEIMNGSHISFNKVVEAIGKRHSEYTKECHILLKIRNAVNHNQFPAFDKVVNKADGATIAEKMRAVTEQYAEMILKGLKHG